MSDATKRALDDAIRAHVADESSGFVTAWALVAGVMDDPDADVRSEWPDGQPGYITVGLAASLGEMTKVRGNE
ncbi:hypothetical protein [Cellulomonas composti]|uniref:Uncharacterized protein n=1 Tax=Cellulomonas composti TaxID=266130 RepID=A0A511JBK1_9CELL|nr:hypothetical protein [Cellulomonas composti]GEL95371.1 hypothetical protein CCO02nite_20290 [Cellulomonas composti]